MDPLSETPANEEKFAVKYVLKEHSADVRAVTASSLPTGGFYTGSRDQLVKLWLPFGNDSYQVTQTFIGAMKFVSSLCTLPPGGDYPGGLVLAGSNDCAIYGFSAPSQEPIMKLMGHSDVVCALSSGEGLFVSGSWDRTARVWSGQKCLNILVGHDEAVWAVKVYPVQNLIVTGSADRTIRIWRQGNCENTFYGHTDCVRGLAITKVQNILSCSNDGTVREWDIKGNTLNVFRCHDNYIYSITLLSNGVDFATCSEDEFVKIWKNGQCSQSLHIKSKTLWSVASIAMDDLIVGCSDGTVCVIGRVKDGETGALFESEPKETEKQQNTNEVDLELNHKSLKQEDFQFVIEVDGQTIPMKVGKTESSYNAAIRLVRERRLNPNHLPEILDFIEKHRKEKGAIGQPTPNMFFPSTTYFTYLNGNLDGLRSKLLEFTDCVPRSHHIRPEKIEKLVLVVNNPEEVSEEQMQYLDTVIMWSDEYLFPALDLLRLALKCKGIGMRIGNENFVNHLLEILKNTKKDLNRTLVIKIFCNMFRIEEGEKLLMKHQIKICDCVKESTYTSNTSHKATASLYLNYAVAGYKSLELDVDQYCMNVMEMLRVITDPDSLYKLFVAIGTVCVCNKTVFENFCALNLYDALCECKKYLEQSKDAMTVLKLLLKYFFPPE